MYEFQGSHYDKKSSDDDRDDWKKRVLRTHPQPYSKRVPPTRLGEYIPDYQYVNTVRDFLSTQGYTPQERVAPPAHIDHRKVEICNDSDEPLNIGVGTSPFDPPDRVSFSLQPGQSRWVLINSYGGSPQYLWPFFTDAHSCGSRTLNGKCLVAGPPRILANNANCFVIKSGVEGVWITTWQYPTFSP